MKKDNLTNYIYFKIA